MGYLIYKNIENLKWDIELGKCPEKYLIFITLRSVEVG